MAFGCDGLESGNFSNKNDDICYVSALGRATTGEQYMLRIPMIAPDNGTFPLGQMFSGQRDKIDGFNTLGTVNSSALGNETIAELTSSVALRADTIYNALSPEVLPNTVNRNALMAFFEGSGVDFNGDYLPLMSMSGSYLTCPVTITDSKYLMYKDGYFVIDGKKKDSNGEPELRKNPYIDKYNKVDTCVMMELAIAPTADTNEDVVFRFPFVTGSNVTFNEDDSENKFNADLMYLAERRHVSKLVADGFSDNEIDNSIVDTALGGSSTATITKVNAVGVITVAGGTAPTIAGTENDVAVVINSTDDTIEVYKCTTTGAATVAVWTESTNTIAQGFVVWTNNLYTALDGSTFETKPDATDYEAGDVGFYMAKTSGLSGVATASKFNLDYFIPVFDAKVVDIDTRTTATIYQAHSVS